MEWITDEVIQNFASSSGGRELHRSWVSNMLIQNRDVPRRRRVWELLSHEDIELDQRIAYDVIMDFMVWVQGHPPMSDDAKELLHDNKDSQTRGK